MTRRALVIGGGIGGVTTAVALARAGLDVAVFEQASQLREVGAGLTVWPNAMTALRALDLDAAVWAVGRPFGVGRIYDWRGKVLVEGARREVLEGRFGWPGTVLHRHRLLEVLAKPLAPGVVRLGVRAAGFRQDVSGVTVTFADGREERGDLLLGADGINSSIRATLWGRRPPRYSGYTAYRGITTHPFEGDTAYESWGVGRRFGFVPGPDGETYWWAAVRTPAGQTPDPRHHARDLLRLYGAWFDPILRLLATTPPDEILRNDVYDRPPASRWTSGRVTLLGDAAHPVTPDLGQGACLAIEDAVVLARCLTADENVARALSAYESVRLPRARFLTRHSRWMGRLGQLDDPTLVAARNLAVGLTPSWAALAWLDWQFAFAT